MNSNFLPETKQTPARLVAGELEARLGLGGGREGERVVWRRCGGREEVESGTAEALVARRSCAMLCQSRRRGNLQRSAEGFRPKKEVRKREGEVMEVRGALPRRSAARSVPPMSVGGAVLLWFAAMLGAATEGLRCWARSWEVRRRSRRLEWGDTKHCNRVATVGLPEKMT